MAGLDGVQNKIHPGDPIDKNLYDLPPEEAKKVPQRVLVAGAGAGESGQRTAAFLTRGGVFSDDMLDAYIDLKMEEVTHFPHDHPSGRVRRCTTASDLFGIGRHKGRAKIPPFFLCQANSIGGVSTAHRLAALSFTRKPLGSCRSDHSCRCSVLQHRRLPVRSRDLQVRRYRRARYVLECPDKERKEAAVVLDAPAPVVRRRPSRSLRQTFAHA